MKKLKIVAGGCIHGNRLPIPTQEGDILILTGDYDANEALDVNGRLSQYEWLFEDLSVASNYYDQILMVDGNHGTHTDPRHEINKGGDLKKPYEVVNEWISEIPNLHWDLSKRFEMVNYDGIRILLTPLTHEIKDRQDWVDPWGWHMEHQDEYEMRKLIDEYGGVDIIIAHGPPYGYGDRIYPKDAKRGTQGMNVGNVFYDYLCYHYKPKLFINSHIHEDINEGKPFTHVNGVTKICNVSMTNDDGKLVNDYRYIIYEY